MSKISEVAARIQAGIASRQDLNGLSDDDVLAIKSDDSCLHHRFVAAQPHGVNAEKGEVVGVPVSTEDQDRQGDVIRQKGWQIDDFKSNPIILFGHGKDVFGGHMEDDLPVALATKVRRGQSKTGKRALLGDERFHEERMLTDLGKLVRRHVLAGSLPGRSVGFIPKDVYKPETDEEREKLNLGARGLLINEAELLEWSVVPIPANQHALQERALKAFRAVQARATEDFSAELLREFEQQFPLSEEAWLVGQRAARRSTVSLAGLEIPKASGVHSTADDDEGLWEAGHEAVIPLGDRVVDAIISSRSLGQKVGPAELVAAMGALGADVRALTDNIKQLTTKVVTEEPDSSADSGCGAQVSVNEGKNHEKLYAAMEEDLRRRFSLVPDTTDTDER